MYKVNKQEQVSIHDLIYNDLMPNEDNFVLAVKKAMLKHVASDVVYTICREKPEFSKRCEAEINNLIKQDLRRAKDAHKAQLTAIASQLSNIHHEAHLMSLGLSQLMHFVNYMVQSTLEDLKLHYLVNSATLKRYLLVDELHRVLEKSAQQSAQEKTAQENEAAKKDEALLQDAKVLMKYAGLMSEHTLESFMKHIIKTKNVNENNKQEMHRAIIEDLERYRFSDLQRAASEITDEQAKKELFKIYKKYEQHKDEKIVDVVNLEHDVTKELFSHYENAVKQQVKTQKPQQEKQRLQELSSLADQSQQKEFSVLNLYDSTSQRVNNSQDKDKSVGNDNDLSL